MTHLELAQSIRQFTDESEREFSAINQSGNSDRERGFSMLIGKLQGNLHCFAIDAEFLRECRFCAERKAILAIQEQEEKEQEEQEQKGRES